MYLQLTNAAITALQTNPALRPTTYKLGTGTGYVPSASDTNIHGTQVYSSLLSNGDVINGNVLRYSIIMPFDIGPFQFGEVGLFTDTGMLFALGVTDSVTNKDVGVAFRLDAYLSSVQANYAMWLDVAETSNAYHMGILQSVDILPSGANIVPSAYIIKQGLVESFRAFNSGNGMWASMSMRQLGARHSRLQRPT